MNKERLKALAALIMEWSDTQGDHLHQASTAIVKLEKAVLLLDEARKSMHWKHNEDWFVETDEFLKPFEEILK